ncbi:MAG TPA: hypothetical protein VJ770_26325, partial [Stellaceae bacterium]|nr:hypothetical protein [Stellaceae bacterium]
PLALAERLRARLQPPAAPRDEARLAWPSGDIGFSLFVAQWPDLTIEVPAAQLYTRYAVLGADGVLRAERHGKGAFCYGPYLNLPAGRYRVRIFGEAAAGAEYTARVACSVEDRKSVPVCEKRYVRDGRSSGAIAELVFASDIELRNFEVVVTATSRSAAIAVAALAITGAGLRPDPES